jgi:tetratricopeptide (TPR) repeat protein
MRSMKSGARPRWLLCISVVAGTAALAGCGGAQSRLASHMNRGQAYFTKGDFVHASVEFRNALQIAPKDTRARLMAARAAEKSGQVREAAGLYQGLIDAEPGNVEARANLGRVFVFAGAPERALKIVEPGLAQHPDEVSLLLVRSSIRTRLSDDSGALEDAEHAIRLAPTNEDAVALRAGLYKRSGDIARAIALVEGALHRLPASTDLREVLAQLYQSDNQPAKAEEQLRKVIELQPQGLRHRTELAVFYADAHKLDEAQRVLEEAVKAQPKSDEAKLTLVSFISSQRTRAQGEKVLRGFIAQQPDNYDLRFGLGDLLHRAGAVKEARETYTEIIQRDSDGPKGLIARDRIALMDLAQNREDDARTLADQVLQKAPRDNDALLVRGQVAMRRGDPAAAITDFRAILRDQPRSVAVQRLLARAYLANDNPALAEQVLRAAIDAAPHDSSVRIELAQLLPRLGHADQAVTLLEQAVRDAPTDGLLRAELVRAYLVKADFQAARTAAEDLKTLLQDDPAGFFLAGLADEGATKLNDAEREYEKALAMQPQAFDVLASLVRLKLSRGEIAPAIDLARGAVDRNPKNGFLVSILGECYLTQKNIPLATQTLTRATELAPTWWLAYRNLALAKVASKDIEGAVATYTAGIKALPHEAKLVSDLATLYEQQGRVDDAISSYETWRQANPRVRAIANNLAMVLVTYKSDQQSLDLARNLIADFASSTDGSLLDTYGWVHFKRAEYSKALPVLARAVERSPDSKEIRYHLGMAEMRAGQSERARADLEAALSQPAKFRGSDEARSALASLKAPTG